MLSARRFPPPWSVEELDVNRDGVGENYSWADMYYFVYRIHQFR
jgi:hypothetical protein